MPAYVRYSFRYCSRGAICTYVDGTQSSAVRKAIWFIAVHTHQRATSSLLDILHGSHDSRVNYTSSLPLYRCINYAWKKSRVVSSSSSSPSLLSFFFPFFSFHFFFLSSNDSSQSSPRNNRSLPCSVESWRRLIALR